VIHFFWDRILGTYKEPDVRRVDRLGLEVRADFR
jgi:sterol desaturase/sphingolipid hydroxylase (fatty acid hydroxylase superfamily)